MDINTLTSKVAAATLAATTPQVKNRNLRTDSKRMAVSKGWDAMLRGARKYREAQGFVAIHSLFHTMSVTGACETADLVSHKNVI